MKKYRAEREAYFRKLATSDIQAYFEEAWVHIAWRMRWFATIVIQKYCRGWMARTRNADIIEKAKAAGLRTA